jgi:fatty acid desaturase
MGNKSANQKAFTWVFKHALIYGLVFFIFYCIGWGFGILPQPLVDGVNWLASNFQTLAIIFCFTIGGVVALKILSFAGKRAGGNN